MKKSVLAIAAFYGLLCAFSAQATVIDDSASGATSYWGSDAHGYGDVIGDSPYDINSADVTRTGNTLTIKISTNFAGHAGDDAWAAPNGIGYGDLFLSPTWNPFGTDVHHPDDNAANGTHWTYGLSLDNRWSNTGGTFTLYSLNGADNSSNALLSDSFLSCGLGTQCYYRNGQDVAVNTSSSTVSNTGVTGSWTVVAGSQIVFTLNVTGTSLSSYNDLAIHWGETCQNDVIEGLANVVPEPAPFAIFGLGLIGLSFARRKRDN